ncbi:hypothetical protein Ancab_010052 [Ancistrocladus abbreviatus]
MSSDSAEGNCRGWAAKDISGLLSPFKFHRRAIGNDDISIKITHCGVCYGDIMWSRNLFGGVTKYPVVPGHEISGIVQEVGANVRRWKVGDLVGVACYVNSCRNCEMCDQYLEYHCVNGRTNTHNGIDVDGSITRGGYSTFIVVHERYVFRIPDNYPPDLAAPLLCAGVSVYGPLVEHNMTQPGTKLGVVGLGGLGHMAVIFGKFWGLEVIVFSTSPWKKDSALNKLKADRFVLSSDQEQMKCMVKSLDCIIDCASEDHPLDPYLLCLKPTGVYIVSGAPPVMKLNPLLIINGKITVAGHAVGGTKITQEMLNFCAENKIYPAIQTIPIQQVYEAHEKIIKKEVKFRYVIDIENSVK